MRSKTFRGGVYPPEAKDKTACLPIEKLTAPEKVFIPLLQHFGKPARPIVKKGDPVLLGQKIGEPDSPFSSAVHASVSGVVLAVEPFPFPTGASIPAVAIQNDGRDQGSAAAEPLPDPFSLKPEDIVSKICEAGIVGMGGAAFPTAVKLSPPPGKTIDTLIINGCECEPIQTADYRLMLEHPSDILRGAELLRRAVGAENILVAVEDNKAEALEALRSLADGLPVSFRLLKTKYPQGAEKMLIHSLLSRKVPRGGLPFDVGVLVQNVATSMATWEAVARNKPLYERVLTCSGSSIHHPKNFLVRIGTPVGFLVEACGGLTEDAALLVYGGPMMGLAQAGLDSVVIKSTTGILAFPQADSAPEQPCIRCARCVEHCPMGLVPTLLAKLARFDRTDAASTWGNMDCIECGCCQYSCPARIPLVHWIRLGKSRITEEKKKRAA